MSESLYSLENVAKSYDGVQALRGVDLSGTEGSVIGLVGRNGAGKSTLIRCLVGLHRPTGGSVTLFGQDPWTLDVKAKQRLGYLSQDGIPFTWARVGELIGTCAPLYPRWDGELATSLLKRFHIGTDRKLGQLSQGQQRAVALLLALCPRPDVLVLDEPAANLDPVLRREFLAQVLDLVTTAGHTVLFSSHILSDVERVADRIALLHEGEVLLDRPTDDLKEGVRRLRLLFDEPVPNPLPIPGVLRMRCSQREVLATVDGFTEDLPARLQSETGAQVQVQAMGLEELFIDLVGEDSDV